MAMGRLTVCGAVAALAAGGVALAQASDVRVEFVSPFDGARLVGTLTVPEGDGPHAAALIVNATGAHPRDEARTGGTHWKELADALAARGVATLRLDARGVGESVSAGVEAWEYRWTIEELAQDASAALGALRSRGEVDAERVGMIAFSDGCAIAALAASGMEEGPAFAAMLSPSGVPAAAHILAEQKAQLEMTGSTAEQIAAIVVRIEAALATLASEASMEDCRVVVAAVLLAMGAPEEQALMSADAALEELGTRGARFYLGYDPSAALEQLRGRAIAIVGGADDRHAAPANLPALRDALGAERVEEMEGLGHFLEGEAEGVFAPTVVERVAGFVVAVAE